MNIEELTSFLMKLMPLWIVLLIFASATVQSFYPSVDIIGTLNEPWIEALLISVGLGGIPLAMFKRIVSGAKQGIEDASKANAT